MRRPVQMQQTLSAYLFGFAFMSLFHGAISDSFGRRPVVLWGLAAFTLASVGCALSQSIGQLIFFRAVQGLSTGAGIVVSRAVIRDMYPPSQAQKVMSQVTIFFGVAPAIAPMMGGWVLVHANWHGIFWFLAVMGVLLWVAIYRLLPETLHATQRQHFDVKNLMAGYWQLGSDPRFVLLALASGVPFNGMFLYILSAPVFLGEHLQLAAAAVLLVLFDDHRRHHGRRHGERPRGRQDRAQAANPPWLCHHADHWRDQPGGQSVVHGPCELGPDSAGHLLLWLGADGAGGHAAGAGPAPRAPGHGLDPCRCLWAPRPTASWPA